MFTNFELENMTYGEEISRCAALVNIYEAIKIRVREWNTHIDYINDDIIYQRTLL